MKSPLPKRRLSRKKTWLFGGIAFVGSLAISLLAAEFALRRWRPASVAIVKRGSVQLSDNTELLYELRPEYPGHNSAGFRGDEFEASKPPDLFRVIALGDSLTYGFYQAEQDTLPSQMHKRLQAERPPILGEMKCEVLNLGVPGYSIIQETALMESKGLGYDPDLTLLTVCLNDWDPLSWDFQMLMLEQGKHQQRRLLSLYDPGDSFKKTLFLHSHLARTIYHTAGDIRRSWNVPAAPNPYSAFYKDRDFYPERFQKLHEMLRRRDIGLIVAIVPYRHDPSDPIVYDSRLKELRDLREAADFVLIDFRAYAKKRLAEDDEDNAWESMFCGGDSIHLNAKGYGMLADAYYEAVCLLPFLALDPPP